MPNVRTNLPKELQQVDHGLGVFLELRNSLFHRKDDGFVHNLMVEVGNIQFSQTPEEY